jgi:hypothetical protein
MKKPGNFYKFTSRKLKRSTRTTSGKKRQRAL